ISADQIAELRRTPGVADIGVLHQLAMYNFKAGFLPTAGPKDDRCGRTIDRPRVIRGRLARRVDELNIGPGLARRMHLSLGDTLGFQSFTPQDVKDQINTSTFDPHGPAPTLRVVGIVRRPLDLGARGDTGGVIVVTRAFVKQYRDQIGTFSGDVLRVRTEHGDADVPRITAAAHRIFRADTRAGTGLGGTGTAFGVLGLGTEGEGAQSAVDITTAALWILA